MIIRFLVFWICVLPQFGLAQWIGYLPKGVPVHKDGSPNLTARVPRLNGRPDFSGLWQPNAGQPGEVERLLGVAPLGADGDEPSTFGRYFWSVLADAKPNEDWMTPAAHAAMNRSAPGSACLPTGPPFVEILPVPKRFVQTSTLLVVLYENSVLPRQIHLDGRPLPADPQPSWMGYSVGKWDGDTLVIETTGFNDKAPLDALGHPRSEQMKLTERVRRVDYGHIVTEVTIEDPRMYRKPIQYRYTQILVPSDDLLEAVCEENEKDVPHLR